jgi:hypothetical protein
MKWKNVNQDGYPTLEGWYLCIVSLDLHDHGHLYQVRWWSDKIDLWVNNEFQWVTHWTEIDNPKESGG